MGYRVALFCQFGFGGVHLFLAKPIDLDALHDAPVTALTGYREGVNQSFCHTLTAVTVNAHGNHAIGT